MGVEKEAKYVAELKIEKIERTVTTGMGASQNGTSERTLDSVTKIIIKADTLERLTEKLAKHIAIVEED